MQVRAATPEDAPAIARVHVASWRTTYRGIVPDAYLDALDVAEREAMWHRLLGMQDRLVIVAELEGDIVGFVSVGPAREPALGHDGEVFALYLLERVQGRGLGRMLLEEAQAWLAENGYAGLMLWVLAANRSVGFYERMGGVVLARRPDEVGGVALEEVAYGWRLGEAGEGEADAPRGARERA